MAWNWDGPCPPPAQVCDHGSCMGPPRPSMGTPCPSMGMCTSSGRTGTGSWSPLGACPLPRGSRAGGGEGAPCLRFWSPSHRTAAAPLWGSCSEHLCSSRRWSEWKWRFFPSVCFLLEATSSLRRGTVFLQDGSCRLCREVKDVVRHP